MKFEKQHAEQLKNELRKIGTKEKAASLSRFFTGDFNSLDVTTQEIDLIARKFHSDHSELTAAEILSLSEYLLSQASHHEEVILSFTLLNTLVKKNYDDSLLDRFRYWLEHYVDNWAQVDTLCLKTIYGFLYARPYLIEDK